MNSEHIDRSVGTQKADNIVYRDRPKLIFINSAETEMGPKFSQVVSNETEAEFYTLFTAETETENQVTIDMDRQFAELPPYGYLAPLGGGRRGGR